jgi:hypothetical protein
MNTGWGKGGKDKFQKSLFEIGLSIYFALYQISISKF